jgi:hypothetical protein
MKIHNPEITGSLIFPRTDGTRVVLELDSAGGLTTVEQNSGGNPTGAKPSADFSGSFTGSFVGDGSNLTGVAATAFNIDSLSALGGASVAQGDNFLISDNGTEKKVTFSNLEDSIYGNVSGDIGIAAGGTVSITAGAIVNADVNASAAIASSKINYFGTGIVSGSGQISADQTTGWVADVKQQLDNQEVISSSAQISGVTNTQLAGSIANSKLSNSSVSFGGVSVALGASDSTPAFDLADATGYLTSNLSGTITNTQLAGSIAASKLAGSIGNSKLSNSSISIAGNAVSLGGSLALATITNGSGIVSGSEQISLSGFNTSQLSENTNLYYTDTRVKTKLDAEEVLSGSITSADITDVAAFSQSGTYANLRAQGTTAGDVGLGNVTNESKTTMFSSPALTGNPTAPTQGVNNNSTRIATTAYVQQELTDLVGTAGSTLDTLGELSASLSEDSGSLASLVTTVGTKLAKSSNLSDLANASTARTNLGVAIGSDVQAFNSTLATVAGGTYAGDNSIVTIGTVTAGNVTAILPSGVVSGSDQVNALASDVNNNTITFTAGNGLDGGGAITLNQSSDETITFTVADGVVSGSSQISGITNSQLAGSIANSKLSNSSVSFGGVSVSLGGSDATPAFDLSDSTGYLTSNLSGTITNTQLAGSIANSKLSNSSITIDGSAVSLGGSVTTLQLGTSSTTALAGDTTTISGAQASAISANSSKVGYTDALVKTKLTAEEVVSGSASDVKSFLSISSSDISDVAAFSQSGTYANLRAQATTKGDVGLGNVTNESKSTMFTSPTFTGTTAAPTPSANDSSTKIATTAYVQGELTELVGTAGSTLDTLGELSASLSDDEDALTALTTTVGTKLAKSSNLSDLANAGTARTNLGVDAAGTDNSTDVTLGNTNYLSLSGQEITGGTVPIGSGGTGATSAGAARTALGVDAAGTDNSTDVTLVTTSHDYLGISGQAITLGTIQNDDLANSSITINGSAISLGGSVTTPNDNTQLSTEQVQDIVGGMLGGTETGITVTYQDGTNDIDFVVASQTANDFTNTLKSKLDNIEENADVTDAANVLSSLPSGVVSGSSQISGVTSSQLAGSIANAKLSNSSITINGSAISLGGSVTTPNDNTQLTTEQVQDIVGGMFSGNTETRIAATYQDGDGTIDLVVTDMTANDNTQNTTTLSFVDSSNDIILRNTTGGAGSGTDDIKFVAGSNITLTHTDADNITITATDTNTVYSHPTFDGDDFSIDTTALSGATVISDLDINITTNGEGHVTDANGTVSTRDLTPTDLGLGNVTNESKSTMFASPTFTGTTAAPTPSANDDSTKIATTAYVQAELTELIGTAGSTLDTLGELSASLSDDEDALTALTTTVGTKLAKSSNLSDLADASTARGNLGVDAAGTDNSTNVSLTGTPDYITISGQVITRNQIDLANDVTGVLPSANLDSDTAHLSGTQTFTGAKSFNEAVNINKTTEAASKTTGALIVDGGVGIAKALQVGGDVVAYASSDERLKDNIQNIENPIEKVQSLKGVTWDWNDNADEVQQSLPNVGVIAQDVEKVLPQLVTDRDNGFKGVDYAKLTGLLIEAVKDQQKQIDELKSKLS